MTKKVKVEKVLKNEKVSKIKKSKKDKTVVIDSNYIENLISKKRSQSALENELIVDNQENTEPVDLIIDNEIIDNEAADDVDNDLIDNETADCDFENEVVDNQENDFDLDDEIENQFDVENDVDNKIIENQENKPLEKPIKKTSSIQDLLMRPCGASMNELMEATGWQKHSIRGTLSNLQKDQQFSLLNVELSRPNFDRIENDKGGVDRFIKETRYFIKDAEFTFNDFLNEKQDNQESVEAM